MPTDDLWPRHIPVGKPYLRRQAFWDQPRHSFMQIPFKRLHPQARQPAKAHRTDAGYDLHALDCEDFDRSALMPGDRRAVRTGLSIAVPEGYYGRIAPRSGLAARSGIDVLAGVIDAGYRGELQVIVINHGQDAVWLEPGQRVAQLIIESCADAQFVETEGELEQSARSTGGFGSTGA